MTTGGLSHDLETERGLLGILLTTPEQPHIRAEVAKIVRDDDFSQSHRVIYRAILAQDGKPADPLSIAAFLEQQEPQYLKQAGEEDYLWTLAAKGGEISHTLAPEYAQRIAARGVELRREQAAQRAVKAIMAGEIADARKVLDDLEETPIKTYAGSTWGQLDKVIGPISWDWSGWLPAGFLTLLVADTGMGKSIHALRLAGCYLVGWSWPDGTLFEGERGKVLWCEAEGAQPINLERAKSWGLPWEGNILSPLENPLEGLRIDNAEHLEALESWARRPEIRLIVLDSLSGLHGYDENKAEMKASVKYLGELARDSGKPIILTHHLRKRSLLDVGDTMTLDRVRGSSTIVQFARMVWAMDMPDPKLEDTRRVSVIKSNLARFPEPFGLTISENGVTFTDAPQPPKNETIQDQASDLLLALLASGPMPATEVRDEIEGAGISWHSAKKAKARLGVVSVRREGRWLWSLRADGP